MNDNFIITIEQYVLRCILEKPKLLKDVDNYFISENSKSLYRIFKILNEKKEEINEPNILKESPFISKEISKDLLTKFKMIEVDLLNFESYLKSLKNNFIINDLRLKEIKNIVTLIESKNENNIDSIKQLLEKGLNKIQKINKISSNDYTIQNILDSHKQVIIDRGKGKSIYPLGCNHIDQVNMIGAEPGYITTIFANTGVGKSLFRKYIVNRGINSFIPIVDDSLEMTKSSETDRLLSLRNGISISMLYNKQQDPNITAYVLDIIEKEKLRLKYNSRYIFHDEPVQDLKYIDKKINEWKDILNSDYFVLHLDLLTMLKDYGNTYGNRANVIEDNQNIVHEIAKKHNIHIIQYLQAQREDNKILIKQYSDIERYRPKLSNIKNASAFENRSRVVLGLFRPKYYADRYLVDDVEAEIIPDLLEVQFLKQSMGHLPILKYYFDGSTSNICPYIENEKEEEEND